MLLLLAAASDLTGKTEAAIGYLVAAGCVKLSSDYWGW